MFRRDELQQKDHSSIEVAKKDLAIYEFADWTLNTAKRELTTPSGCYVALTSKVFDLLVILLMHPQQILSREFLLENVLDRQFANYDRSVDVLVGRLRQKLQDDSSKSRLIKTIRNGGYMLTVAVQKKSF